MPKPARLGPDWLTDLLYRWGKSQLDRSSKGIGYYTVNPMLRDGIPQPAASHEPTGYSGQDYRDLERAVAELETIQQLAIARFCMPWRIRMIDAEHEYMTTRRWLVELRAALELIDSAMSRKAA